MSDKDQPEDGMLFRFSLYGFLKNQKYYEPFIILALLDVPLSFLQIGVLVGFREICINLFEVPSGAVADVWGRRRSMVLSFVAYIISFVIFGGARSYALFFAAMLFFAVGEAFRTGTHKAIIFDWLARQDRLNERTRVYGFTRSWSKLGSAVSVLIAAALVYVSGSYRCIFYFTIPIYVAGIINFLGYPPDPSGDEARGSVFTRTKDLLLKSFKSVTLGHRLRGLLGEAMLFDGSFKVIKDYLQPLLKAAAIALPLHLALTDSKRTAVLIGVVFFVLHLFSSFASRNSHKLVERAGSEDRAALWLWGGVFVGYGCLALALWRGWIAAAITVFVGIYILQNYWRPAFQSRIAAHADNDSLATVLSIEGQSRALAAMIIAPVLGYMIDRAGPSSAQAPALWTVGALGAVLALAGLLVCRVAQTSGKR